MLSERDQVCGSPPSSPRGSPLPRRRRRCPDSPRRGFRRHRRKVGAHVGGVFNGRLDVAYIGVHHVHRHAGVILERIGVDALGAGPVRACRHAARRAPPRRARCCAPGADRSCAGAATRAARRRFARTRRRGCRPARLGFGPVRRLLGRLLGCFGNLSRRDGSVGAVGGDPGPCSAASGSMSSVMTGISPVNSATVTASEFPRRRRRRAGTGAPCVPFLANSSATEMGRVLSFGPVISCRRSDSLADFQLPARMSLRGRFRRLRYRVCAK